MTSGTSGGGERRADHLAERRVVALRAADRYLVPLLAVLVDAEDADVADVVVAARVHAARHVELEVAEIVQVVEIVEAPLDRFGDRNGLRVGERAEIAARAADDVGQEADVRRRETQRLQVVPEGMQVVLQHVGEHQVLLVGDAQPRRSCSARRDRRSRPSPRRSRRRAAFRCA